MDPVKEHVIRVLEVHRSDGQARLDYIGALEQSGRRIIEAGQTSSFDPETGDCDWEISDWRTGELIAEGTDGRTGFDAACERLDPDGKWYNRDIVALHDVPISKVKIFGVPPTLAEALEEWVENSPPEEIAEFIGWPVEKVAEYQKIANCG